MKICRRSAVNGRAKNGKILTRENIGFSMFKDNLTSSSYEFECPDGFVDGPLPMTDKARLAHSISLKNNPKLKVRKNNRGFETLYSVLQRIDENEFKNDFYNGSSDEDLCIKYNITKYVCKDYRKVKRLLRDSQGRCRYNENN